MRARRPRLLLLTLPALVIGSFAAAGPVLAAPCDGSSDASMQRWLRDARGRGRHVDLLPRSRDRALADDRRRGQIEIWGTGFLGVPAGEGNAFAELNANTAGTLYQDVICTPGATMSWTLLHRGREGR